MHRLIIPGVLFTKLKLSLKQIQIIIDYNLVSSPIGTGESLIYHNSKTLISPPSFIADLTTLHHSFNRSFCNSHNNFHTIIGKENIIKFLLQFIVIAI